MMELYITLPILDFEAYYGQCDQVMEQKVA